MPYIKNKESDLKIFYHDLGKGDPVILIHGWPLNAASWELQMNALVDAGFRVIAYDRRGFGKSDIANDAYDYGSLTSDLDTIITGLKLDNVSIIGFSMGGGEVVRYFTDYDGAKVVKAGLIASIIPLVAQKADNPDGVPQGELEKIANALATDRVGFLKDFHKNFYNYGTLANGVSEARLDADFIVTSQASGHATIKAAAAWAGTDFRSEMKNVKVPTLIVHGDEDKIVPIKTSGDQAAKGIANNEYHVIKGAPHGLNATHADELNKILIAFLRK
jgi:non-heme chloroperoxidase